MTSQKELRDLIERAIAKGAIVTVLMDDDDYYNEGREIIKEVQVLGLKGVGPNPMSPISASERLREVLCRA